MNYSFWEKKIISTATDITIIGSGIVGLSTAISIAERFPALTIKIVERGNMPYGASTKNAGFSCFGSISELLDDIHTMGVQASMNVVKTRWQGLQKLRSRVGDDQLHYQPNHGAEIFRSTDRNLQDKCIAEIDSYNSLMYDTLGLEQVYAVKPNHFLSQYEPMMIVNQYEGSINPMMMMQCLFKHAVQLGVEIFYGINIRTIDQDDHRLMTDELCIDYKKLIVCTNGFTRHLLPHLEVYPARNQVLITKPIPNLSFEYCYHLDKGYVYFRTYENRILLGGGRNIGGNAENTDSFDTTERIRLFLVDTLSTIHDDAHVDHFWSGILGIGPTKSPICQWVSDDVLVGVRMGGMGVAIGSFIGESLAEMITKKI